MKTTFKFNSLFLHKPIFFFLLIILFTACKKESDFTNSQIVSSTQSSEAKTDGVIKVQAGILPPVTQKSFIVNGQSSQAQFQISTRKHIFLYQLVFTDSSKTIEYIVVNGYGVGANSDGVISLGAIGYVDAGSGYAVNVTINYKKVDSTTSGSRSQLALTDITYRTDDDVYHDFYPQNGVKTQPMYLVNNLPHILFQNPSGDTLKRGYKQIAAVQLSGDTNWALNILPLTLSTPYSAQISNAKLIITYNNNRIAASTDLIQLGGGGNTVQAIIKFKNGFMHTSGSTEILKIFAPVTGQNALLTTTLNPLNSFVWTDGLGKRIGGAKNNAFFNEQTGTSIFHQ